MTTIADQFGKFEPLLQHKFRLFIDEVGGAPLAGREQFEISVQSAALPNSSAEVIEVPVGSEFVFYAGRVKPENMAITCRDLVDASVYSFIYNWYQKLHDTVSGRHGYRSEYAGTARIQMYGPDAVIREWKYINIWPQALNSGTGDMTSNDIVPIEVTFQYDKAIATIF